MRPNMTGYEITNRTTDTNGNKFATVVNVNTQLQFEVQILNGWIDCVEIRNLKTNRKFRSNKHWHMNQEILNELFFPAVEEAPTALERNVCADCGSDFESFDDVNNVYDENGALSKIICNACTFVEPDYSLEDLFETKQELRENGMSEYWTRCFTLTRLKLIESDLERKECNHD